MFSSLLDQEGDRGRATKAHQAAPPSPDAKIRPGSAAGVNRIPLIEASGAPRGAPPPPSSILLSLWRESGPGRRFPFFRFSLFPEADGIGAPWLLPDKGSRDVLGLSLGLARPTSIEFDCFFF